MPTLKMKLYSQNELTNIQNQVLRQHFQYQPQSFLRLGSSTNRNFLPLQVQGNKSCKSCSGK